MAGPLVVSVGGGAVLAPPIAAPCGPRHRGLAAGRPATLAQPAGPGHGRPLLSASWGCSGRCTAPHEVLVRLGTERRPLYEEVADIVIDVDDLSPPRWPARGGGLGRARGPARAPPRLVSGRYARHRRGARPRSYGRPEPRSYPVLVGPGARHALSAVVPGGPGRWRSLPRPASVWPSRSGRDQRTFLIGDGEQAKCLATVEELCRGFAQFGLTRADLVVGVGGGVVTDVAGFAAAVYHRGVPSPMSPPPCWARSTPPSGARPASTCRKGKTWWAPSGSPSPSSVTPRCCPRCLPGSTAAAWARWPSTPFWASPASPAWTWRRRWRAACLQGRLCLR